MFKSAFSKDIRREIFKSISRFLSIFLITLIGCGFFAGIKLTTPAMKETANNYFKSQNLMDLRLISTIGIQYDDIKELKKLDFVEEIEPTYAKDVFYTYEGENLVLKAMSYNKNADINKLNLIEGRLPKSDNECVIEKKVNSPDSFKIGNNISVSSTDNVNIDESLKHSTFKIVGIVTSPLYIGYNRDTTSAGSGKVSSNIFLHVDNFKQSYYSDAYVKVKVLDKYSGYSDEYTDKVDSYKEKINKEFTSIIDKRYNDLVTSTNEQITSAKEQLKSLSTAVNSSAKELLHLSYQNEAELKKLQDSFNSADANKKITINSSIIKLTGTQKIIKEILTAKQTNDKETIKKYQTKVTELTKKIKSSESLIENFSKPSTYTFTRFSSDDYSGFSGDSEKIDMIATVFPVFFILIAALICITTMTRMIEEHRIEIGTYKAMGYSSYKISLKYFVYVSIPALLGSVIGVFIGSQTIPRIIYDSYKVLYNIENLYIPFKLHYYVIAILVSLACTSFAVAYTIVKVLNSNPSVLMRPKAPQAGKRVFLEKIGLIWNRFSFLTKVSIRNLFRYKKRFFMTIIGIAGCTALIVTAFGLRNSINAIVTKQFNNVFKYSGELMLDSNSKTSIEDNELKIENIDGIKETLATASKTLNAQIDKETQNTVSLIIPKEVDRIKDFYGLNKRGSTKQFTLSDDGVIVTEKLCSMMNLDIGDNITLSSDEGKEYTFKIEHITENYASHFVYLTPNLYKQIFEEETVYAHIAFNTDKNADTNKISNEIMKDKNVLGVSFLKDQGKSFTESLKSLDAIVYLLIICAAGLAIVVLYNLSNINITERVREIATIKVLGFYDKEVSSYIVRESVFTTTIGILVGFVLGFFLHKFVTLTSEVDIVMFDRDIIWWAFFASAALTVLFSLLVNFILYFKLKKIEMVESLKSIE